MKAPTIVRGPITYLENNVKSLRWWIQCPNCNIKGMADIDQMRGRVSIQCDCGYHETHELVDEDFRPVVGHK